MSFVFIFITLEWNNNDIDNMFLKWNSCKEGDILSFNKREELAFIYSNPFDKRFIRE